MRRISFLPGLFLISFLLQNVDVSAKSIIVSSLSEYNAGVRNLVAGDTILWAKGTYKNVSLNISRSGLIFLAEEPGMVVFTGNSSIVVSASNTVVSGFQLRDGSASGHAFNVTGSNNKISHINIENYSTANYFFNISAAGRFNLVEHCNFENKAPAAAGVEGSSIFQVQVHETIPGYNVIRFCSFKNHTAPAGSNGDYGMEALRIGYSYQKEFVSRTIVEYCYFAQCKGDDEIISNKARQNVFRYNTFYNNSQCHVTMRHGSENVIYGNFFIKGGGIRIKEGQNYSVYNNYFETGSYFPIKLENYNADPLDSIIIAFNTVVGSGRIELGGSGNYKPKNVLFVNNIFAKPKYSIFNVPTNTEKFIGNLSDKAAGITIAEGFDVTDETLLVVGEEGYYALAQESPAIDFAKAGYDKIIDIPEIDDDPLVSEDIAKNIRPVADSLKDVGCAEFSGINKVVPYVSEHNTGPSYLCDSSVVYLKLTSGGGGSVSVNPAGSVYARGTEVSVLAQPATGKIFSGWYNSKGILVTDVNPYTFVLDVDGDLKASFITAVGIEDRFSGNSTVKFFPNPADKVLIIDAGGESIVNAVISITDILGNKIIDKKSLQPDGAVDVSYLASGFYFVSFTDGEKTVTGKFFKE